MVVKEAIAVIQVRDDGDFVQYSSSGDESGWMLDIFQKVEQTGFPNGLDMRCERRERCFQVFGLSIWKGGVAVF